MNEAVNNLLTQQLFTWEMARTNYAALASVQTKQVEVKGIPYQVQFNPARILSSGAKVDAAAIQARPCFLCAANRPAVQQEVPFGGHYNVLLNPFPIFPRHLTIPEVAHVAQLIAPRMGDMLALAEALSDYVLFYNGPTCGASAPDHAHFQAGNKGFLPLQSDWRGQIAEQIGSYGAANLYYLNDAPRTTLVIESYTQADALHLFHLIHNTLPLKPGEAEPMMNVLAWKEADQWIVCILPRERHRPTCYALEGAERLLCSPASVDLGGVFILPREEDFRKITAAHLAQMMEEVCLSPADFAHLRHRIQEQL